VHHQRVGRHGGQVVRDVVPGPAAVGGAPDAVAGAGGEHQVDDVGVDRVHRQAVDLGEGQAGVDLAPLRVQDRVVDDERLAVVGRGVVQALLRGGEGQGGDDAAGPGQRVVGVADGVPDVAAAARAEDLVGAQQQLVLEGAVVE